MLRPKKKKKEYATRRCESQTLNRIKGKTGKNHARPEIQLETNWWKGKKRRMRKTRLCRVMALEADYSWCFYLRLGCHYYLAPVGAGYYFTAKTMPIEKIKLMALGKAFTPFCPGCPLSSGEMLQSYHVTTVMLVLRVEQLWDILKLPSTCSFYKKKVIWR